MGFERERDVPLQVSVNPFSLSDFLLHRFSDRQGAHIISVETIRSENNPVKQAHELFPLDPAEPINS